MALAYPRPMVCTSWLLLVSISPLVLVFTVIVATHGASAISASPSKSCQTWGKPVLYYCFFLAAPFFRYISLWAPGAPTYPRYGVKGITVGIRLIVGSVSTYVDSFPRAHSGFAYRLIIHVPHMSAFSNTKYCSIKTNDCKVPYMWALFLSSQGTAI
jgi:hypothetical protein